MHIAVAWFVVSILGALAAGAVTGAIVTAQAPPPHVAVFDTLPINTYPRHHHRHIQP